LGSLNWALKEAAAINNLQKIKEIFPDISSLGAVRYRSNVPRSKSREEWRAHKADVIQKAQILAKVHNQIEAGKLEAKHITDFPLDGMEPIDRFFDWMIPDLKKICGVLYPENPDEIPKLRESFKKLNSELRKIRQYHNLSQKQESDISDYCDQIERCVKDFAESWPRWSIAISRTIENLPVLIEYSKKWIARLKGFSKIGAPLKRFNVLVFHVVNWCTYLRHDVNADQIIKDKKPEFRKNWQLICATLLWLNILCRIPKIEIFLNKHKEEQANIALKRWAIALKKMYFNFQRSGKSIGKRLAGTPYERHFVGIPIFYSNKWGPSVRLF